MAIAFDWNPWATLISTIGGALLGSHIAQKAAEKGGRSRASSLKVALKNYSLENRIYREHISYLRGKQESLKSLSKPLQLAFNSTSSHLNVDGRNYNLYDTNELKYMNTLIGDFTIIVPYSPIRKVFYIHI